MWLSVLKYLAWVGQLGLSLVLPPVLSLWAAAWVRTHFELGGWVFVVALAAGLLTSARSLSRFLRMVQKEAEQGHERRK